MNIIEYSDYVNEFTNELISYGFESSKTEVMSYEVIKFIMLIKEKLSPGYLRSTEYKRENIRIANIINRFYEDESWVS